MFGKLGKVILIKKKIILKNKTKIIHNNLDTKMVFIIFAEKM